MIDKILIKTEPGYENDLKEVCYETITLKHGYIRFSRIYEVNPREDVDNIEGFHNNYEWIYESNNKKSYALFDKIVSTLKNEIKNSDLQKLNDAGSFEIMMFDEEKKELVKSFDYNFKWNNLNESQKLIKKLFPSAEELPKILIK